MAIREGKFEGFAPQEATLLRMADAMADTPSHVSDELYAELRQYFSEEQLIELAASAARENFRARFNRVFDVASDGLYRKGLQFKQRRAA
jgi:alkylhydroperoxidase family enzyme